MEESEEGSSHWPAITESVKGDTGTLGGDLETIGIGSGGSATDLIASVSVSYTHLRAHET